MAVTLEKIKDLEKELMRFADRLVNCKKRLENDKYAQYGCSETGALRRASMYLSKKLIEIRK